MLTFLKKLGTILVQVAGAASGIGPILGPFFGSKGGAVETGVNDLTKVASVIVSVETIFGTLPPGTTGAQKLAAALPLVAQIIKTSELVSGKKIANDELFTKAIQEYTQATVDLLNAIHPDEAAHA